jgi:hypothetical protein
MNAIEILEQGAATLAAQGAMGASWALKAAANHLKDPEWLVLHPEFRHGSSVKYVGMLTEDEERAARKNARRQQMERSIARRVIRDAKAAGYVMDVDGGGDELDLKGSTNEKAVMDALFALADDAHLILRKGRERGMVWFVFGNEGWSVIADYSVNIEPVLAGASALAERLEEREDR